MADEPKNAVKLTQNVNLRIPQLPGMDQQVLVAMVQGIMAELHFWSPLTPLQELGDIACLVVADLPHLEQVRVMLAEAPRGAVWGLEIAKRPAISLVGAGDQLQSELFLQAPAKIQDCRSMDEIASFTTMIGYLTSTSTRGLLALSGRRARIHPPGLPGPPTQGDGVVG